MRTSNSSSFASSRHLALRFVAPLAGSLVLAGCMPDHAAPRDAGPLPVDAPMIATDAPSTVPVDAPIALPDVTPLATNEAHFGHTHAELAALWWQWVFGLPREHHPLYDTTGEDCAVGQSEDVFFLAGTFGGPASRQCTVPAGQPLFFPLVNNSVDNGVYPPEERYTDEEQLEYITAWADGIDEMTLEIDGTTWTTEMLRAYRAAARYSYDLSDTRPNLYDTRGIDYAGEIDPAFTDGYWIYLPPLPPGAHHIHFTGQEAGDEELGIRPFSLDVEYDLTVL